MSGGSTELDPLFLKALGYFWSKSPDSTAKLKKMFDDAVEQSMKKKPDTKSSIEKVSLIKPPKHVTKIMKSSHEVKKKEKDLAQKRQFEKIQKDLEELDQEISKKLRYDNSAVPTSNFASTESKMSPKQEASARRSPTASADDKDFEMDGLACVICNVVSNGQGNTPVECQECHNMYHRECHHPPIRYQDVNDPRCIWYCARCTKTMKKVAKQNSRSTNVLTSNTMRERMNSSDSKNKSAFVTPFKRNEIKSTIPSSNNAGGGSLSGWAALSGKNIHHAPPAPIKVPTSKPPSQGQQKPITSAIVSHKDKRDKDKMSKASKAGPKLLGSDAWAEALGADLPPAPSTGKSSSIKSVPKSSASSWGSSTSTSKSSMYPKVAATSIPGPSVSGKSSMTTEANAIKRLQMLKKKPKFNPKKSKP